MEGSSAQTEIRKLKDQVTPYKVCMMVVVEEYCKYDHACRAEGTWQVSPQHDRQERQLIILFLQLVQSADMELKDLLERLQSTAKTDLLESITSRIEHLCEGGVGSLMDLMLDLPKTLFDEDEEASKQREPLLEKPSVLGLFIRRMLLAFNKLAFRQITKVQEQLKLYVLSWKQTSGNESSLLEMTESGGASLSESAQTSHETSAVHLQDQAKSGCSVDSSIKHSQRQAELFIAQQSHLLAHNETAALPPKQLQEKIAQVLASNPLLAEAHFLSYMNNLRVYEYCSALESLFHYFDRQQALCSPSSQSAAGKSRVEEEGLNRGFRYAALNLAALQYRFGHSILFSRGLDTGEEGLFHSNLASSIQYRFGDRKETLIAVQEAIRMAQEAKDHVCLQHALSWLQRLGVEGSGVSTYLLDRLVTKSEEHYLPYLNSLGVQAFAKHNAVSCASPSSVFELLLKSDVVNCQNSLSDLMCTSYAQKAALWDMYGHREMSLLSCQLMLNLNTSQLSIYHNAEAECLGLCCLATIFFQQGEYDSANQILNTTKERFPKHNQYSPLWMQCEQQLAFKRALYEGNVGKAEQAMSDLASVNKTEAQFCQCLLHKEKGEWPAASELCEKLIKTYSTEKRSDSPQLLTRLLLLKADLLCSTDSLTEASTSLLECIHLCKQHHYSYQEAMATLHLAFLQYRLGLPFQALRVLESAFTRVLSHGGVYDKARALYLWVKCTVSGSKHRSDRMQVLTSCVPKLNEILTMFTNLGATHRKKDLLYYQARLYNELGYISERNQCARGFKEIDLISTSWNKATISVL